MPVVLVVEDQAATRQALARLLRSRGYKVIVAADAYGAMGAAKQNHPDLILLDVMIPPMDGLTFLMLLRQDPESRDVPVIVLTGLSDENTIARSHGLGVKEILIKGEYTAEELLSLVEKYSRPQNETPAAETGDPAGDGVM